MGWDVTIENCYNTGDISSTGSYAGGIVGDTGYNQRILNCYNTGRVSGNQYVGGLVGDLRGGTTGSAQYQGPATLTNGYNVGEVTGTGSSMDHVANIAGRVRSAEMVSCYYLDTASVGDEKAEAVSEEALRALELGDAFGLTCHGYPALKWQTNVTFHTLENGVVTAPTCTERGYTTYVCPTCGETVYTQYTDALGHTEDVDRTVVYQMYRECVCAVCGETYRIWNDVRLSYIDFQYHKEGILNAAWSDEGDDPWSYQERPSVWKAPTPARQIPSPPPS